MTSIITQESHLHNFITSDTQEVKDRAFGFGKSFFLFFDFSFDLHTHK